MNHYIIWALLVAAWLLSLYIAISWTHIIREWRQWREHRRRMKQLGPSTKGLRKGSRWPR